MRALVNATMPCGLSAFALQADRQSFFRNYKSTIGFAGYKFKTVFEVDGIILIAQVYNAAAFRCHSSADLYPHRAILFLQESLMWCCQYQWFYRVTETWRYTHCADQQKQSRLHREKQ